jgi:hypothetical protein
VSSLVVRLRGLLELVERNRVLPLSNDFRVRRLRARGVRIGQNCLLFTTDFWTEPYLVESGDHVANASGVKFAHDASIWLFEDTDPEMDLPRAAQHAIGSNCIIGAWALVRGNVSDNSVVMGDAAPRRDEDYPREPHDGALRTGWTRAGSSPPRGIAPCMPTSAKPEQYRTCLGED